MRCQIQIVVHGDDPHPDEQVAVVHVELHVETSSLGGPGNKVTQSNLEEGGQAEIGRVQIIPSLRGAEYDAAW